MKVMKRIAAAFVGAVMAVAMIPSLAMAEPREGGGNLR